MFAIPHLPEWIIKPIFPAEGKPDPGDKKNGAYTQDKLVAAAEGFFRIPASAGVFAKAPQFHGTAYYIDAIQRREDQWQ
jgi:hypothetical protein